MLLCETFPVGPLMCNCTILADSETKEAIVVDPGGDAERIAEIAAHHGLTVRHIVHTHGHIDHIFGTREVKERLGGAIELHAGDLFLYDGFAMQAQFLGLPSERGVLPVDRFLAHGDELEFGKKNLRVLHTPGHTPGSVCFSLVDADTGLVFSGDTLFRRSVGRTDLWGGDQPSLFRSIRERLYTLAPETVVVPGHGPKTTIEEESAKNPFVQGGPGS